MFGPKGEEGTRGCKNIESGARGYDVFYIIMVFCLDTIHCLLFKSLKIIPANN